MKHPEKDANTNQQSSVLHIIDYKDKQKRVLSFQNGNAGFDDKVNKLLLVTEDVEDLFGTREKSKLYKWRHVCHVIDLRPSFTRITQL